MPRDLLMAVISNKYEEVPSSASQDEEDPLVAEAKACLALKEHIFDAVQPGEVETLRPSGFSALEFFSANKPRTCAWLEAPLHLFVLRKIAVPPDQVDSNPPFVPKAAFTPDVNTPKPLYPVSPTVHPLDVDDVVLRRLAAAGFCSSSLAFLAGTGGWRGFAGLLSAPAVCGLPNDIGGGGHQDSGPTQPLVSSDQCLLCRLYAHFQRVYKGLVLNASHYEEADHRVKSSSTCMKIPPGDIKWAPGSAVSVLGWTGAPAGLAPRKIKTLSIQESINLMNRVRQDYLASWRKFNLPALPKLPPQPALSLKYRETELLDEDDDAETLSADESDCETVIDG
ncbi:unnamed protein product [Dibothriocephalus latus]|uniref:Uncharacterized protein n=1 Tax=Dibothriocephalus latus TaxID=60516 RepID=A0A3P7LG81_DIBLA|nr:unnamed protein product [Dibothriocephalus latus]